MIQETKILLNKEQTEATNTTKGNLLIIYPKDTSSGKTENQMTHIETGITMD